MNNKFFYCYDEKLAKWLRYEKGMGFITKAIHPRTIKVFYLFEVTTGLTEAINEFQLSQKGQ